MLIGHRALFPYDDGGSTKSRDACNRSRITGE